MRVIASHPIPALPVIALNWIDGECVDANKTTSSFDPAMGERIGPSQFGRETGMVVGANSATAQCGEWKEDEWQELLTRLSTGCMVKVVPRRGAAEELEHAVSEHGLRGALIEGYSNVRHNESSISTMSRCLSSG